MTPDGIQKHLTDRAAWTVEDHIHYARTGKPPINPAYHVLHNADTNPGPDTKPVEELSIDEHLQQLKLKRTP